MIRSPSIDRYHSHLLATINWLLRSIEVGRGGSVAYYSPIKGWSAPYPETSGYMIPTLLDAAKYLNNPSIRDAALTIGHWLLTLQHNDGWWQDGLYYEGKVSTPSVFNTAQIVDGMCALARETRDSIWLTAALKASSWLANGVDTQGVWKTGNYIQGVNPSYYTQVAWPMLTAWKLGADKKVRDAAIRVLSRVLSLKTSEGTFRGWSFTPGKPAFTHTIAYTLRGLLESALLLEDWQAYGAPCEIALERLVRKTEFTNGRLPGSYYEDWRNVNWYSCLTGNAQIAICIMKMEEQQPDLRLLNASVKLVDYICSTQHLTGHLNLQGAVAGSSPFWGRYMFMRFPNWAAKYHADALMMLIVRLNKEGLR